MQTNWKRFHHTYSSRGSWAALLSVLTILLFAAAASEAQGPPANSILVSQATWYSVIPQATGGGGILPGDAAGGSSWGINSKGVVVASATYGGQIVQWSGLGEVGSKAGTFTNAGGVAIDSAGNLYAGGQFTNAIIKVPMNADGTYTFTVHPGASGFTASMLPACTGVAKTDTASEECLISDPASGDPSGGIGSFGVESMTFDATGDMIIATDDQGDTAGVGPAYSIFLCSTKCLYKGTADPVLLWTEPITPSGNVATVGQLYIGTMGIDPWGNLFFTDDAETNKNGTQASSYVKELPVSAGAGFGGATTGFAAAPITLASYSDGTPSQYDDQIDTLYIDPQTGTVYYALANEGIFAIPNTSAGANPAGMYGVTSQGAKLMKADTYGNFYVVANTNISGFSGYTDTLGYISFSGPAFAGPGGGTTPVSLSPTSANFIVADNTSGCTPTLTIVSSDPLNEYSGVIGNCSGMGEVGLPGSFTAVAGTFTPAAGVTTAPTAALTITDTTSSASTKVVTTGSGISGVDQSTWLASWTGGGVFGGGASDGHTGAINSKGVVITGSAYSGNGIQEYVPAAFPAAGATLPTIGTVGPLGGAGGMAIDKNDFLYASNEYGNSILKMPMQADGTYAAFAAAPASPPSCAGDSSTTVDQAGICQIAVSNGDFAFGIAALAFDKNGNLLITSDAQAKPTGFTGTYQPYSILACNATCMYGSTPGTPATQTDPVVLWAEPAANSVGQYYIGPVAVDSKLNLYFTDSLIDVTGSVYSHSSNLKELPTSAGAGYAGVTTGYAAAPATLESESPTCTVAAAPCTYNNEIDGLSIDSNDNIFFADQYTGIFELVNNSGSYNLSDPLPVAAPGAKMIIPDTLAKGNFYFAAYDNGDTLGYDQLGGATLTGIATAANPTTATVNVLSSNACAGNQTLAFTFDDMDFAAPSPTSCGAMGVGGGSNYTTTITYTPSPSASGNISATMTASNTTSGGSGTAAITAKAAAPQTITGISGITSPVVFGAVASYTLSADTGPAGNAPVFTIDTTLGTQGIASITASTLTITGVGTFDIDVNMAGGTNGGTVYANAPQVVMPITVTQGTQTIVFTPTTPIPFTATPIPLVATGGASGNAVTFTATGTGAITGTTAAPTLTLSNFGTVAVTASQLGNANYLDATPVTANIVVNALGTVATPTFSLAAGTYYGASNAITITSTKGATIYYTTDGTTPTTASTKYTAAIPLATPGAYTIKAYAVELGYNDSLVASASYTVSAGVPNFTLSVTPGAVQVAAGSTGAVTVSVTGNPATAPFVGSVSFYCSGQPEGASCDPLTIGPPATGSTATGTLKITTTAASIIARNNSNPLVPGATFAVALCCFLGFKKRRRLQMLLLLTVSVIGLGLFTGCGAQWKPTFSVSTITIHGTSTTPAVTGTTTLVLTVTK